jgi:hypothetical protein
VRVELRNNDNIVATYNFEEEWNGSITNLKNVREW